MLQNMIDTVKKEFKRGRSDYYSFDIVGDPSSKAFRVKFRIRDKYGYLVVDSALSVHCHEHKDKRLSIVLSGDNYAGFDEIHRQGRFEELMLAIFRNVWLYNYEGKIELFAYQDPPHHHPILEKCRLNEETASYSYKTVYWWINEEKEAVKGTFPYEQILNIIEHKKYVK